MAFPVETINGKQLEERCIREGDLFANGGGAVGGLAWAGTTSGGGSGGGNFFGLANKAMYIKSLTLSSSLECFGQLLFGQLFSSGTVVGNSPLMQATYNVGPNGVEIPLNMLLKVDRQYPSFKINSIISQAPELIAGYAFLATNVEIRVTKARIEGVENSGIFSYNVTVTNNSGSATSGIITVKDTLPEGLRYLSSSGSGWAINESSGTVTATTSDVIAANGTKIFTVNVAVKMRHIASIAGLAYSVDNDINYDAPAIWWNGTSITAGSGVPTYKQQYSYLLRNYIRDTRNIVNRVVNKAVGGSTSSAHEEMRKFDNRYDPLEIPLAAVFEHAANDAAQIIPPATTVANMIQYINHWRRMDGGAQIPIIIFAPIPTQDPTNEARHVILNNAFITAINDIRLTDMNVHYIASIRNMFNPVTQSGTYTSDGLHLNTAGNILLFNQLTAYIEANNLFLNS